MTIIVSGNIRVKSGQRDRFIERPLDAVTAARRTAGCLDFAVSADPLDENRVNILEKWRSREDLLGFRGNGSDDDIASLVEKFDVDENEVE